MSLPAKSSADGAHAAFMSTTAALLEAVETQIANTPLQRPLIPPMTLHQLTIDAHTNQVHAQQHTTVEQTDTGARLPLSSEQAAPAVSSTKTTSSSRQVSGALGSSTARAQTRIATTAA